MSKSRQSSLLEAAERFDRLVKLVKDNQFAATGATAAEPDEIAALHPEEAWARRFATHTFRLHDAGHEERFSFQGFLVPPPEGPSPPSVPAAQRPAPPLKAPSGSHIGAGLGKAGPRRGWLARLLRGR